MMNNLGHRMALKVSLLLLFSFWRILFYFIYCAKVVCIPNENWGNVVHVQKKTTRFILLSIYCKAGIFHEKLRPLYYFGEAADGSWKKVLLVILGKRKLRNKLFSNIRRWVCFQQLCKVCYVHVFCLLSVSVFLTK